MGRAGMEGGERVSEHMSVSRKALSHLRTVWEARCNSYYDAEALWHKAECLHAQMPRLRRCKDGETAELRMKLALNDFHKAECRKLQSEAEKILSWSDLEWMSVVKTIIGDVSVEWHFRKRNDGWSCVVAGKYVFAHYRTTRTTEDRA